MNFWEKPLTELTDNQWEALCDGCGLCCMHKFENEDTGDMLYTRVACRLFDDARCACMAYANRFEHVPHCMHIRQFTAEQYRWLPKSCAYRLRFEHQPLLFWHPLISGDSSSVHQQGISLLHQTISEQEIAEDDVLDYIIDDTL